MKHLRHWIRKSCAYTLVTAMIVSLLTGAMPMSVKAAQPEGETGRIEQEYSVEGTNTLGTLVANQLNQTSEDLLENMGYNIYDINMFANLATVEYSVLKSCTLMVAIYDESGTQMLGSGMTDILASEESAEVMINIEVMPEYFMVKGYLFDSVNMKPLNKEYSTPLYTKSFQDLLNSTVDDYDSDRVLNLDADPTTNFMVYKEDTIRIPSDDNTNVVARVGGEDSKTYTVTNIDETVNNLKVGDIVAFGNDIDVTISKIASINIVGTTATITEDDVELKEIFDYVKIEENADSKDLVVDESACEEGIVYEGRTEEEPQVLTATNDKEPLYGKGKFSLDLSDGVAVEGHFECGDKFKIKEWKNDQKTIKINGNITINMTADLKILISDEKAYVKFAIGTKAAINATMKGELKKGTDKIEIGMAKFTIPATFLNISVEPKLVLVAETEIKLSAGISSKVGFAYDSTANPKMSLVREASLDVLSVDIEGSIGIGLAIEPAIEILSDKIAEVGIEGSLLLKTSVKTNTGIKFSVEKSHDCKLCMSGDLSIVAEIEPSLKFTDKPIEIDDSSIKKEWPLYPWYFSVDHKEFGKGECPYIIEDLQKANILVKDKDGNPIKDALVTVRGTTAKGKEYHEQFKTNAQGIIEEEILRGEYLMDIEKRYYYKTSRIFNWNKSTKIPDVVLTKYDSVIEETVTLGNGTEIAKESPYKDCYIGTVVIADDNFSYSNRPFHDAYIEELIINEGVTKIPKSLFQKCTIEKIVDNSTLVEIGSYAFSNTVLPKNYTIPNSVLKVGGYAFARSNAKIPLVAIIEGTEFDDYAFSGATIGEVLLFDGSTQEKATTSGTAKGPFNGAAISKVTVEIIINRIPTALFRESTIKKITFYDTVTVIGDSAFRGATIEERFIIPNTVQEIGEYAFYKSQLPYDYDMGVGIKKIGREAFSGCTVPKIFIDEGSVLSDYALKGAIIMEVELWDGSTYEENAGTSGPFYEAIVNRVTIMETVDRIPKVLFRGSTIKKIDIASTAAVTEIGNSAFSFAKIMESFKIPDTVQVIGEEAFYKCMLLEDFSIGAGVKTIEDKAFKEVTIENSFKIPDTVQVIGKEAFYKGSLPEDFDIGAGVKHIGMNAFTGHKISKITIEEGTVLDDFALKGSTIEEVVLKDGSTYEEATTSNVLSDFGPFNGAVINKVTIEATVTRIPTELFRGSTIQKMDIASTAAVTEIGNMAFREATIEESFKIPDTVQIIGEEAFYKGSLPEDFDIGAGVKNIGANAFTDHKISKITIKEGTVLADYAFHGVTIEEVVLKDGSTYEEATTSNVLSDFGPFNGAVINKVIIEATVTRIPAELFRGSVITNISLPASVTEIGELAFAESTLPANFSVSSSVTVEDNAFKDSTYNYVAPETSTYIETEIPASAEAQMEQEEETSVHLKEELMAEQEETSIEEQISELEIPDSAEDSKEDDTITPVQARKTNLTGLRPNDVYNFYAVKEKADYMNVELLLAPDNILYIGQVQTDANGNASISYSPRENVTAVEFVTCMSRYTIEKGEVAVEDILYTGEVQQVLPSVTRDGKTLTLYEDYDIAGDYEVKEVGKYNVVLTGKNDYCGSVLVEFEVITEKPQEPIFADVVVDW